MTVPLDIRKRDFVGNAATLDFPLPFPILDSSDLVVTKTLNGQTSAVAQVEGVDYEVTGTLAAPTVSMTVAPQALSTLHVERTVPMTQDVDLLTQGPFSPATHTRMADKDRMCDQQLEDRIAALEALVALSPAAAFSAVLVTADLSTDPDAVENSFPVSVPLPAGITAVGVVVVRVTNLTHPAQLLEEAVFVDWAGAVGSLTLNFVTGLDPASEYSIVLLVLASPAAPEPSGNVIRVTRRFTTLDPIESTFPLLCALPGGFVPTGVDVVRVQNLTVPANGVLSPVFADWSVVGANLSLRYVFGLDVGVEYQVTMEVSDA